MPEPTTTIDTAQLATARTKIRTAIDELGDWRVHDLHAKLSEALAILDEAAGAAE